MVLGDGTEMFRAGGVVWVTGRHTREAVLAVLLEVGRPLTIEQILAYLESSRVRIGQVAQPNKAVSDVMRYQARLGRVIRMGRGLYRAGPMPRTTDWRMRARLRDRSWPWAFWEVADSRKEQPGPVRSAAWPSAS